MGDWRIGRYRWKFCAVRHEAGKRHRHTLGTTDRETADRLIRELNRKSQPQARTVGRFGKPTRKTCKDAQCWRP